MKKTLLLLFCSALLFTGCSDSDSDSTQNDDNTATGTFTGIRRVHHETGYNYETLESYTDGNLMQRAYFTPVGDPSWHENYTYTATGLIATYAIYDPGITTPNSMREYTYNTAGKLVSYLHYNHGTLSTKTTFIYSGATITYSTENYATQQTVAYDNTYYVNVNGVIYKQVDNTNETFPEVYETLYDGYNPISSTSIFLGNTIYSFDDVHDYSLLGINDGNGSFKANAILRNEGLLNYEAIFATKYITEIQMDLDTDFATIDSYTYVFAENGKPLSGEMHRNGTLTTEIEYIYE